MFISFTRGAMPVLPVRDRMTRITVRNNDTDSHVTRYEWRNQRGFYMPLIGMASLDEQWVPLVRQGPSPVWNSPPLSTLLAGA